MYQRQKSQNSAKLFFTYLQKFQVHHAFRIFKQQVSETRINNFFESQDIPQETFSRNPEKNQKNHLPPISIKALTQIPNNNSMYQVAQSSLFPEKRDNEIKEIKESAELPNRGELYKTVQEKDTVLKTQMKKNKGMPMKFGDIVFFKFTPEISQSNIKTSIQGVVTGDGIASNRLECVSCEAYMQKNALNMFRKSLFCIENQKKYTYQKSFLVCRDKKEEVFKSKDKLQEEEYEKSLKFWKNKAKDEKDENQVDFQKIIGHAITYGQAIQLRHIYSNCYLTLKSEDLARQNGCVEMTLEENDTEHSNFKFLPFNNLRNIGDVVSYSDIISLANWVEENYFLHIASEQMVISMEEALATGLEVNGAENQSSLKVNCYLNHSERQNNEEIAGRVLLNGDIVTIFNREASASLTVAQRNINQYFVEKNVMISSGEDKFSASTTFKIQTLNQDKITESDSKLAIFIENLKEQKSEHRSYNGLWEIQRKKTFDGSILDISEPFRLKNVATGLFLSMNFQGEIDLVNTAVAENGNFNCYFNFVSKFAMSNEDKSIKYNEGLKIKVNDGFHKPLFLGYTQNLEHGRFSVGFNDKRGDSTRFLFELKASNPKSREFADRISSLVPYLLKFYQVLQDFGMVLEKNKQMPSENVLRYDYEKALQQEKELENEISQLFESLQNLNDFLKVDLSQEDESMFKLRQNILNDQKIIEILIAIAKLIEQMCRGANIGNIGNDKTNLKLKKQDRQNSNYKSNVDKSPFSIARKHLESPVKEIYKFLYFAIKGNPESSQFVLEFDEFLKGQLKFFFKEISALLKEAIRCSFLLKKDDIYGNQLSSWASNLETLNENNKNIEFQALYLQLLAYSLVDANDAPINKYQETCLSSLFQEVQARKITKLLKFAVVSSENNANNTEEIAHPEITLDDGKKNQRAIVSFPKEELSLNDFMENNPSLQALTVVRRENLDEDRVSFYVDEFLETTEPGLSPFIDFICSTLKLLAYLIKGRNLKSMKKVKTLGITATHILLILEDQKVHDKIKANYLHIFQYLCLDKEPFIHLSNYENRCVIWNDLDKFASSGQTFGLINNIEQQIKNSLEGKEALHDYSAIEGILMSFWSEKGCKEFNFNQPNSNLIELFMNFLKFTRVVVDLGYSNKAFNDSILNGIGHIFGTIMEDKVRNEDFQIKDEEKEKILKVNGINQNHWIYKFMEKVVDYSQQEEIEAILHQTTKIFMIFTKIRINLQIINFLKTFKTYQKDEKMLKVFDNFEPLFHIYDFNVEHQVERKTSQKPERPHNFLLENFIHKNVEEYFDNTFQGLHLDSIFLYSLFSSTFMSVRLRDNILKILVDYFNQRSFLLSELIETEILDTEEELKVYNELDGVTNSLVSVQKLNSLIEKLLYCDELVVYLKNVDNNKKSTIQIDGQIKKKLEKIPEIMAIVDNLLTRFKDLKQNPYIFLKTQNILRNLQYHEAFFKILKHLQPTENSEFELIYKILKFFGYFVFLNGINQQGIIEHSNIFFRLLEYRFPINRLFSEALNFAKSSNKVFELINNLFDLLEGNDESKKETRVFKDLQVLSMLQSLLTDESKNFIPKIQKKILAKLLKNKRIVKFTQTQKKKNYSEYRNSLMSKLQNSKDNEKYLEKIQFHISLVHLFGNLCRDFKMGILQMQKVLVYEQIKNLLFDVNTPFLFKKAYLKTLFEIYIAQTEGMNLNFTANDIAEYLNQLVLPDLNIYTKYLEGLVKTTEIDKENCRMMRERIIENRAYYQSSLDLMNEDKSAVGTSNNNANVSILRKAANNANQSGLVFDSKKIIDDPTEYWDYMFGGKTWDNTRDGLFYFLLDCFYEADRRKMLSGFDSNDSLTDAFSMIKSTLVRMKATLQKLEKDFNLNFADYYLMIMEGITQLPTKIVTKAGKALKIQNDTKGSYKVEKVNMKEEQDQKIIEEEQNLVLGKEPSDLLLDKIRTFLIKKRMKIHDFLNLFEMKLEMVPKRQFIENFIAILPDGLKIKGSDIENLIEKWSISKTGPGYVNFFKFSDKMRRFFIKKKFNYEEEDMRREKKEINVEEIEDSFKKDNLLTRFIKSYYNKSLKENRNKEISDLALKFKKNLENSYDNLVDEDLRKKGYVESLKKLLTVFKSDVSEIFLIKLLKIFLEDAKPQTLELEDDQDEEEENKKLEEKRAEFQFIQNVFDDAGVCAYSLGFIKAKTPLLYIYEAICLLINCLDFGNFKVQMSILEVLKRELNTITGPFFNFVKSFLIYQGRDEDILGKNWMKPNKFKLSQFTPEELILLTDDKFINKDKVLISIVKLLSLCCENCNIQFQNFLREQSFDNIFKQNFVSTNIVLETSTLLTCLSCVTNGEIVAETLTTLSEYNMGPCNENQSIFCNNKKLLTYLKENIIKLPIDFSSLDDKSSTSSRVFSKTIEFLLSLVIGHKDKENIQKLVNNLDIPELFRKMNQIFKERIRDSIQFILQENRNYLSEDFLDIIKTGFDIFILLTIFKEFFPNHTDLNLLDLNQAFSMKKYNELKAKYEKRCKESNVKKISKKVIPIVSPKNRKRQQVGTFIELEKTQKSHFLKLEDERSLSNLNNNEELERLKPGSASDNAIDVTVRHINKETQEDKLKEEFKEFFEMKSYKSMKDSLLFYKGLVGSVEVQKGEELSKIYFQKPFVSDFKTVNIKYNLIYSANRDSDQSRLEHLFYNVDKYYQEMKHRQRMYRFKILNFFIEFWRSLKDLSFLLIFVINILLLASYTHENTTSDDNLQNILNEVNFIVTIIQLFICFMVVLFCMIERYPISIHRKIGNFSAVKKNSLKIQAGLEISHKGLIQSLIIDSEIYMENFLHNLEESKYKYVKILLDPENIYNFIYLSITMVAFFYPLVYCVLFLDLIKRSEDLQNIIKAVTFNVGSLVKTALLGCAVIYIFSVIAYLEFSQFYTDTGNSIVYATSLIQAFTSTLNSGLRSGGGIGDALSGPKLNDGDYWDFWVFTLVFFIIINILFINIIFGIIIDTFGELRDARKELLKDVEQKCFICGVDSYDFETKGNGWLDHIYLEHNVYNYLDFLIYINNKNINDCNGIEKYVKELVNANKIDFLPIGKALALHEENEKPEKEKAHQLLKILNEFSGTLTDQDFSTKPVLKTFVLKNDIIIKEIDEPVALKLEIDEYPVKIFDELINIMKSSSNYFNIYLKKNSLPLPAPDLKKAQKEKNNEEDPLFQKRQIVNYQQEKLFQSSNFNHFNLEKDVMPLVFNEKLAKALGMKSIYSPPPYFNKLVDLGMPYYYKKKRLRYYGLNDYLPTNFPRNEWRKTKINKRWLRKKPEEGDFIGRIDEKWDSDVMIDESKDVEREINKHIRCAVPIYEEDVEIEHISDDD